MLQGIALESKKSVLDSSIDRTDCFFLTYQLVGQHWSTVLQQCNQPTEAELSALLDKPVIELNVSDGANFIGYRLFEQGELMEYFQASEEDNYQVNNKYELALEKYILQPYPIDPEYPEEVLIQTAYFWSREHQMTAEDIGNIWDFVNIFLEKQDAYDPAFDFGDFLGDYNPQQSKHYQISMSKFYNVAWLR